MARIVFATRLVDKGFRVFNEFFVKLRSRTVLACATDEFYEIYNDLTYGRNKVFREEARTFRSDLWPWEKKAISQHFPPPPGTLLVGAAGGGREALALARQGYRVVAFDPIRQLATSLADMCGGLPVESLLGRYEDLPVLNTLSQPPAPIDLRSRPLFSAAILGWGSISHLRSDQCCIETLRQFRQLTHGPILVSWLLGRPKTFFDVTIGYRRCFTGEEIRKMAEDAGLEVVATGIYTVTGAIHSDNDEDWYAVLRARSMQPDEYVDALPSHG
jgi:hypothetical protein